MCLVTTLSNTVHSFWLNTTTAAAATTPWRRTMFYIGKKLIKKSDIPPPCVAYRPDSALL